CKKVKPEEPHLAGLRRTARDTVQGLCNNVGDKESNKQRDMPHALISSRVRHAPCPDTRRPPTDLSTAVRNLYTRAPLEKQLRSIETFVDSLHEDCQTRRRCSKWRQ
ncbi:hypothetical protein Hamer_G017654, partial [Homarus americanus]